MEKTQLISVTDQFEEIKDLTMTLKVLREGIREAEEDEFGAWQRMTERTLEFEVTRLNSVLFELSRNFEGLEYKPIKTDIYGSSNAMNFYWANIEEGMEKPHKDHDALEIFNMAKNLSDQDKELFVDLLKNLLRKAA